jgi:2-phosphosulfolactate phosphatase
MGFTNQSAFEIRCEWGCPGVDALVGCRTFIVIDVLSFSTCVATVAERRAVTLPYPARGSNAAEFARQRQAFLAGARGTEYSLSPLSLLSLPPQSRLVLPSPNGAAVSLHAVPHGHVLAGCLRNRAAVCRRAVALGGPFGIIPAGERWSDGSLRPALEDLLGAGAIAAMLPGNLSPEAAAAVAAFDAAAASLQDTLLSCSSGVELVDAGFRDDVEFAATLDVCASAPELIDESYVVLEP